VILRMEKSFCKVKMRSTRRDRKNKEQSHNLLTLAVFEKAKTPGGVIHRLLWFMVRGNNCVPDVCLELENIKEDIDWA